MISIAVIDDEQSCIDEVVKLLQKYFPQDLEFEIFQFLSGTDFLLNEKGYDIIFMDIEMEKISGVTTIQKFKIDYPNAIVFFVTSHNNYIAEIFRLGTFQFLQKPINEEDFKIDINRAVKLYKENHHKIEIKENGAIIELNIMDILYIEVYQKKIKIHTEKKKFEHNGSIYYYENKLSGYGFAKSHKSYLINMQKIQSIKRDKVTLNNLEEVPLSRNYKQIFLNNYNKYSMGERL